MNERNGQPPDQEESEYHFSDDDVSYEVEPETETKPAAPPPGSKFNFLSKLTNSKRMIITLVVFLVLVFVVYRMVTPVATPPSTDIIPASPVANVAPARPAEPSPPSSPITAPSQPATAIAPAITPPVVETPSAPTQVAAPETPTTPVTQPTAPAPSQSIQPAGSPPAGQAPLLTISPPAQAPAQTQPTMQPVAGMPNVIPVQASATTQVSPPPTYTIPPAGSVSPGSAMTAQTNQVMGQLQTDYTQRMSDFAAQTKATQEQVQALTARVSAMENQLHQLVQALTHEEEPRPQPVSAPTSSLEGQSRYSYTVQAIIPGRAWLKADNGETITVAEGDSIRGVGRVVKIDPYDGVVEVNNGNRVISLSYGSTG